MKRTRFLFFLIILTALLAISGCSGSNFAAKTSIPTLTPTITVTPTLSPEQQEEKDKQKLMELTRIQFINTDLSEEEALLLARR